ncbi:MAG: ubiquinone biosynthesis regulatory protein kinase UbiB, partial [Candidatus Accumulibacter sp.]|nr:ubiquinone biosynthesis regulatory protein kinase UbiB [Accumulibacter sp.]
MHLLRIAKILGVAHRHGIDEMLVEREPTGKLAAAGRFLRLWRRGNDTEAVRLRRFLEDLGPIFVKFGQVLSTRRDLLPVAIADEFARLQDRVPPFPAAEVHAQIEAAYGKPASEVFAEFDETPVASASVAQVHFARLRAEGGGREVAVKILRPDIESVIVHDLALLDTLAGLTETLWSDGKRLKPREIVAEFAKYLYDELDLMREAANASQLRRNFKDSKLLLVPEMYWDYCSTTVIVMDRMRG